MKCDIEQDQMPLILNSLKTCENIKFLNLSENLVKGYCESLTETLKVLKQIEVIGLNNCQIGLQGIVDILQVLKDKTCLKELYLAGNEIGDDGIKEIKNQFSSKFRGLKALNLVNNKITEKSVVFLYFFLKTKPELQYLRLGHNKLKALGVEWVLKAFSGQGKLNDFDVGNNEIGDEGSKCIEKFLMKYPNLLYLNVMKNEISEERIVSILNILKKQSTPCKINVFGNKAKDENIQKYFTAQISSTSSSKK